MPGQHRRTAARSGKNLRKAGKPGLQVPTRAGYANTTAHFGDTQGLRPIPATVNVGHP